MPGGFVDADRGRESRVSQDINVLALVKGEERYIFLYDDQSRAEALRTLGRRCGRSVGSLRTPT